MPQEDVSSAAGTQQQSTNTRRAFWRSRFPPFLKDLVFQALWAKVKVGERLQNWTNFPWCPICWKIEIVQHALTECRFVSVYCDTIEFCWEPSYVDGRSTPIRALPTPHSFHTPQGVSLWIARAAHWSFRNLVKQQAILPNGDSLLSQWSRVISQVVLWEPLHSMSAPLLQFHDALATLSQTGALPKGIVTAHVDDSSSQDKHIAKKRRTQERKQH